MLDANICGYIIRYKPEGIKDKLKTVDSRYEITLSSIVVSELLYGAAKKGSPKLTRVVRAFIDSFTIHDFDELASAEYADIRNELEKQGTIIGSNDLFIAAHAKSLNATLVSNNTGEFQRVRGLKLENWV
jgi:tRNA(fMet)-specific endonuclease VapC